MTCPMNFQNFTIFFSVLILFVSITVALLILVNTESLANLGRLFNRTSPTSNRSSNAPRISGEDHYKEGLRNYTSTGTLLSVEGKVTEFNRSSGKLVLQAGGYTENVSVQKEAPVYIYVDGEDSPLKEANYNDLNKGDSISCNFKESINSLTCSVLIIVENVSP